MEEDDGDLDPRTLAQAAKRLAKYTSENEVRPLPEQQWADLCNDVRLLPEQQWADLCKDMTY
eukprot:scaffold148142_cov21-Tisochrysis_lutea.AAC.1